MVQKPSVEVSLLLNIHENSLLDDVIGGRGGLNITPHLVNPLMNFSFYI
jgi:hypothetical protein